MTRTQRNRIALTAFAATLTLGLISAAGVAAYEQNKSAKKHDHRKTVVDVAAGDERFSTLVTAIKAADLAETLKGEGPFTVFAPTNKAFAQLPDGTLKSLLKPENRDQLRAILTYHVAPAMAKAGDVIKLDRVTTVQGQPVRINATDKGVILNGSARVIATDVVADNGVIHVIDSVLMPPQDD